jgi:hypothetical protein
MKDLIMKCISIIRLQSISTKWTPTPENYIPTEIYSSSPLISKDIISLLTYLHHISLDISIKEDIKAVTINAQDLIQKFRNVHITPEIIPDEIIADIPTRWKQLIQIRDKVSRVY